MADIQGTDIQYNQVSLAALFRQDYLYGLQNNLRDATGISFFIIDYRGNPVTDYDHSIVFCPSGEKQEEFYQNCQIAYAMAAATSAIQNIPYIFNCPEGVLNIAVPVIVKNQYLGALIGGPVLCEDDAHLDFETIPCNLPEMDYDWTVLEKYKKERLEAVASLVYRLIGEIGEKQSCLMDYSKYEHQATHFEALRKRNQELTLQTEELVFQLLRMRMPSQLFLNLMTSLSNVAIMENAENTEKILSDYSMILREYLLNLSERTSMDQEIQLTEHYLNVLKNQFDQAFEYRINCQSMLESQQIPSWSLIPYVIYMIDSFLVSRNSGGHFFIDVEQNGSMCRVSMQMEGGPESRRGKLGVITDRDSIVDQMESTEKRFRHEYGDHYSINAGIDRTVIEIPMGA